MLWAWDGTITQRRRRHCLTPQVLPSCISGVKNLQAISATNHGFFIHGDNHIRDYYLLPYRVPPTERSARAYPPTPANSFAPWRLAEAPPPNHSITIHETIDKPSSTKARAYLGSTAVCPQLSSSIVPRRAHTGLVAPVKSLFAPCGAVLGWPRSLRAQGRNSLDSASSAPCFSSIKSTPPSKHLRHPVAGIVRRRLKHSGHAHAFV